MTDKGEADDIPLTDEQIVEQKKKKKAAEPEKGEAMCRHGFHDWIVKEEKKFDAEKGKHVTLYKCQECGKEKLKEES